ncbi:dATP pyrophosphohydrolase [Nonomuraea solani]|uniref:dATP pyrophosphohydrolase n=1 Tax=Nonomuraea solani TaxID=1144553 RepID=A0A1H6EWU9_9ACTN|nr:NUDIX domain-containing protein [Nonomuraea solani]SEH02390.1 dATP pyrophosphohydrolase [Nonomuraea solani]
MREPYNVVVYVFRTVAGGPEYAVFQRSDDGHWQGVSGGGEAGEDPPATARRESAEEAGLPETAPLYELDMISGVEKECFAAAASWPEGLYIVTKHYFAIDVTSQEDEIVLSGEHRAVGWLAYEAAREILRYDDDRTALWELDQRLRRDHLPKAL